MIPGCTRKPMETSKWSEPGPDWAAERCRCRARYRWPQTRMPARRERAYPQASIYAVAAVTELFCQMPWRQRFQIGLDPAGGGVTPFTPFNVSQHTAQPADSTPYNQQMIGMEWSGPSALAKGRTGAAKASSGKAKEILRKFTSHQQIYLSDYQLIISARSSRIQEHGNRLTFKLLN